ncbi:MAG: T9SS type A sorting domain-containing protein [Flavobacteriales bacterium]|nr:T9SS type A sorting domain-containing protein [Flavobacteriales bacterium]
MRNTLFAILFFFSFQGFTQDTLTFISYNLLNFPNGASYYCGSSNQHIPERDDTLKIILEHLKPTVLAVCELQTSAGADSILKRSLNSWAGGIYKQSQFVPIWGGLQTHLFFDSTKVELVDQHMVTVASRDISHFILKHLGSGEIIHAFVAHLKAGNYQNDRDKRADQTNDLMAYIDTTCSNESYVLMGDLNFYTGSELGFQNLIANNKFLDPINEIGSWSNNYAYRHTHTQSPRYNKKFDCGATGGINDRFDFILCSENLMDSSSGIKALASSYRVIGNDGNHFDDGIMWQGNSSQPQEVLWALYHCSDHLPVVLDFVVESCSDTIELLSFQQENGLNLYVVGDTAYADDCSTLNSGFWFNALGLNLSDQCSNQGDNGFYFTGNKSGGRSLTSHKISTKYNSHIKFDFKFGHGSTPCEQPDPGEDVYVEYSIDGFNWFLLRKLEESAFDQWTSLVLELPFDSLNPDIFIRWIQPNYSGKNWDIFAIDNVVLYQSIGRSATIQWSDGVTSALSREGLQYPNYSVQVNLGSCVYDLNFDISGSLQAMRTEELLSTYSSVLIFPQPNQGQFQIEFESNPEESLDIGLQILSIDGKVLYNNIFSGSTERVLLSLDLDLRPGRYLVNIMEGDEMRYAPLMIY